MRETYISMEDAAVYEGISYKGITARVSRNPENYKTKTLPAEAGGKPRVKPSVQLLIVYGDSRTGS